MVELTSTRKETQAGNYFVSNYPPFDDWSPENISGVHESLDRSPVDGVPLGLYLHIPFCRKRCHFCYFKVITGANSSLVNTTLDTLVAELKLYAERQCLGNRKPKFIYFGGGTPSFLSANQLRDFTDRLKELLPWDQIEEVAFECEPGTLTEAKLEAIRAVGVTRLSLGVEHFDDDILEVNGRAHRSKEIGQAYAFSRNLDFSQINIDLIAGMVGETEEKWRDCVARTLSLNPDSVTVYQMEVPYNTSIFKKMQSEGKANAPVADWPTKRRWVGYAFEALEKQGYTISSAYTAVKNPDKTKFVYRDALWTGADMLALGVASFSHINRTHFQNDTDLDSYIKRVQRGELPLYRGLRITHEEQLIREFILQLKLGQVKREYFRKKFDVDIISVFSEGLEKCEAESFLVMDQVGVTLSRDGLLRIDSLLPLFFLPEHRGPD